MRIDKATAIERLRWLVTLLIRISLLLAALPAIWNRQWAVLFVTFLTLFLTFLPWLLKRKYRITLPVEFELGIVIFVYASLFLGDLHEYYTKFWWWDVVLHAGSGLALGLVGFILAHLLATGKRLAASPLITGLLTFSFALAAGSLWEIAEFTLDGTVGTHMQRSGLIDTMWDLIVDACGALVAAVLGWRYSRRKAPHLVERLLLSIAERERR